MCDQMENTESNSTISVADNKASTIPKKEVNFQNEIKKRDEIISRLSNRLKESLLENEGLVLQQSDQVEQLKKEIEKLQAQLCQADEKLKSQELRHLGSVEAIENVKDEVYSIKSSLQNKRIVEEKSPNDLPSSVSSSEQQTQCDSVSSSDLDTAAKNYDALASDFRELKQKYENLEEKRLKDLITQDAELSVKYEEQSAAYKQELENQFNRRSKALSEQKHKEYIKALQKMMKRFKQRDGKSKTISVNENKSTGNSKETQIQKLAVENKELAEVRDILLQQMEISMENQAMLKKELNTFLGQDQTTSDDDILMDDVDVFSNDVPHDMPWEAWPCSSGVFNPDRSGTSLGFFEDTIDEDCQSTEGFISAASLCQKRECIEVRRKLQKLFTEKTEALLIPHSLSNGEITENGLGSPSKTTNISYDRVSQCAQGDGNVMNSDVSAQLQVLRREKTELEEKIEFQFKLFADEKNNFAQMCDSLKTQVENLLLAKSHLEQELEGKNAIILTLSEEFQNTLGRMELSKEDLEKHLLQLNKPDGTFNNDISPNEEFTTTEEIGRFVREEEFSSLDMITMEHSSEPSEIEFWDTNFNTANEKLQLLNKPAQIFEVDPELQLQGGYGAEQNIQYISELDENKKIIDDLVLQVNSLERQLKSNKQFISEQLAERELERDDSTKEICRLSKLIEEKDAKLKSNHNLYQEIGDMKDRIDNLQEDIESLHTENDQLRKKVTSSHERNIELENLVKTLETEVAEKALEEGSLPPRSCQPSPSPSCESNEFGILFSESGTPPTVPIKRQKYNSPESMAMSIESEIKIKHLEERVTALNYKLKQEKIVSADLLKSLLAEQTRYNALMNKEREGSEQSATDALDQWEHVSKLNNALKEEQDYRSSILDVLEKHQAKYKQLRERLKEEHDHRLILEQRLSEANQQLHQQMLFSPDTQLQASKIQRLYARYLRAESYRKALIYQKNYLLILIGGYQDTEETTLAMIAKMGCPSSYSMGRFPYYTPMLHIFRRSVTVVIAILRMKYMVKKWRRAVKVGSPVVGGSPNVSFGYLSSRLSSTSQESLQPM